MGTNVYQKSFVAKLAPFAQEINRDTGIPACIIIAQGILESNWGRSGLTVVGNNLFGIKGKKDNKSGSYATKEQLPDGTWVTIKASFRHYPDWSGSVKDHSLVLLNTKRGNGTYRYRGVVGEKDYKKAANLLYIGGYATDKAYASKLIYLIETYNLDAYNDFPDKPKPAPVASKPTPVKPKPTPVKPAPAKPKLKEINGIRVLGNIEIAYLNNFTYVYDKPSDISDRLTQAKLGKVFPIAGSLDGWYEIIYEGKRAYVKEKYAKRV